ncbi:putative sugar fermentation stimulation protein [Prochlorococcus marinus str. MIT 9515]|uniref:Sugar fermentation stimulation protein homolog n=1 Tax=Prochlorococcus marinus (strain MIT 9515) TaxID=167542 RepID=SFSA_PROM5|nr:DNA/RNA nuclease SfsA [Prochlorococcus marinus]A2BUP3.1 RecName: Full=Sugar fermentation stimulation protein homolog [Prochlorococcus marinus str. MIT 9515]ABM71504.1 putative sugar fermentation stimulation protein [Prochlorococcus marinus str. MIT 9515]
MDDRIINFEPLIEGVLIKRYKRFLSDIKLDNGEIVTAHCANTGPMKGLLNEGAKVRISYSSSPKRKLSWTWEQVEVTGINNEKVWVGINTLFANKLIKTVIEKNLLKDKLGDIATIQSEVVYGQDKKSRIDFLLTPKISNPDNRKIFIEVKNTTWKKNKIALFPDTETKRGQKHLIELKGVMPESKSVLVPCITRKDVDFFGPGDEADPIYGDLFRDSIDAGMLLIPCCFEFHKDHITWKGFKPLKLDG